MVTSDSTKGVQSIEVGFRLIQVLLDKTNALPLKELAKRADMSPSKAHPYLASFKRLGIVSQNSETGNYGLGPMALDMGLAVLAGQSPLDHGERAIKLLRERGGVIGTLFLSIWTEHGAVVVLRDEGITHIPMEIRIGFHTSLINTATGRVFLSYLAESITAPVSKAEAKAPENALARKVPKKEREAIKSNVLENGFSVVDGITLPGLIGTAIPLLDHNQRLVTVLTHISSSSRTSESQTISEMLNAIENTADTF